LKTGSKIYTYYELTKQYRDASNKSKVVSKFIMHMGSDPSKFREKYLKKRPELAGKFTIKELMNKLSGSKDLSEN